MATLLVGVPLKALGFINPIVADPFFIGTYFLALPAIFPVSFSSLSPDPLCSPAFLSGYHVYSLDLGVFKSVDSGLGRFSRIDRPCSVINRIR